MSSWGRGQLLVMISLILRKNFTKESSPATFSGYHPLLCGDEIPGAVSSPSVGPALSVVDGWQSM